jgi:hypothetical protein
LSKTVTTRNQYGIVISVRWVISLPASHQR